MPANSLNTSSSNSSQDDDKDTRHTGPDYCSSTTPPEALFVGAGLHSIGAPVLDALPDEHTALLPRSSTSKKWVDARDRPTTTFKHEAAVLAKSSIPLWITFLLQYSLTFCSIFAAGNLGSTELAAVSLATMTAVITGYAPYQGLSTALDTLCSQAYGSGNKKLVGLQFQRMVYFLMLLTIPIAGLWVFSDRILGWILPDPELAAYAGLYLRILALGAPGYATFEAAKRYVMAQGLFAASTYVLLIVAPLNGFLNYLLVWHPKIGMGFAGAPTAVVITNWLMPLLLFLYVRFINGYECWGGFTRAAFKNWWPMVKLAIPGLVMMEAEFLAFEILTLVSSYLGTEYVATQSVLSTTASMAFQLPFAISVANSTRVANFLGAQLGDSARIAALTGLACACCTGLFNVALLMAIRHQFVRLFTSDPRVIALFVQTLPLGAAFQFFDSVACLANGVLRGQGRQHIGSYLNAAAYNIVAIPLSLTMAFVLHWELIGLWTGVSVALILIAASETLIIFYTDWDKVVDAAKERVNHG